MTYLERTRELLASVADEHAALEMDAIGARRTDEHADHAELDDAEAAIRWGDDVTDDYARMHAMSQLEDARVLRVSARQWSGGVRDQCEARVMVLEVQARVVLELLSAEDAQRGREALAHADDWHPRDRWNLEAAIAAHEGREVDTLPPPHRMGER